MIFEQLVLAGTRYESIRRQILDWTLEFIGIIERQLQSSHSGNEGNAEVAWGIVSLYFNYISLMPLKLPSSIREQSAQAALRLVESLEA